MVSIVTISTGTNLILQRKTTPVVAHDSKLRFRSLNHVSGKAIYSLTTVALAKTARGGLGSATLIAEPEGPTFISYKVARSG